MSKRFAVRIPLAFAAIVALSALACAGAPAQAAEGARCLRASQCHGALPHICRRCDGHTACAHWACVRHRCEIRTCPE
jgi:hypothetical protein